MPEPPSLPLVLTMGEPAGIGGEIAVKAWLARNSRKVPPFVLIDDVERLEGIAKNLGEAVPIEALEDVARGATIFGGALPVLPLRLAAQPVPGRPDRRNAAAVLESINRAVDLAIEHKIAGVVTNPIHKATLYASGFTDSGHTEYLSRLTGVEGRTAMMLSVPGLRVVPVTVHLPFAQVPESLNETRIVTTGRITAAALEGDFGVARPRLAVAALNPHAGEDGTLGKEEIEIIGPAVDKLRSYGIDAFGPRPADTLFHEQARKGFDAALCMYHDQALIPLKTIDFAHGVNITMGLPIVRTSPDHGTALDIVGRGIADPRSLIAALNTAASMAAKRGRAGYA